MRRSRLRDARACSAPSPWFRMRLLAALGLREHHEDAGTRHDYAENRPWILALGILPVSAGALGRMQSSDGSPARPTNAAPLVPVRFNADGNFRIGPPYVADPAFTARPDVPKGRVIRFTIEQLETRVTMNSAESKLFQPHPRAPRRPRTRARRTGSGTGRAAAASDVPASDRGLCPSRIRAQYASAVHRRAGRTLVRPRRRTGRRGRQAENGPALHAGDARQPDRPETHPLIVAVLLSPGPGGQRTIEYDTVSDRYVNFVETEVLPRITRDYQVAFTTDPEGRAAFG
jgi:enterochelin esterase family protein